LLLDSFLFTIAGKHIDSLIIEGHTDSTGEVKMNNQLSLKRANTVAEYFSSKDSLSPGKIFIRGLGSSTPIENNLSPAGRQKNRRVEIYLYIRE
jgi:outer membrane protein OmpA-like peptidoglycan-associated protein